MAKAKITPVKWIEDPLTAESVRLIGQPFKVEPAIPYSQIDIRGGLHNKAREHNSLDEDLWLEYACKMEAGHPFKYVVLFLQNDGIFKYGVAHGNHRLRAYACRHNDDTKFLRSAKATVGAYVIQSPYTDDIEEYERLANGDEGSRQSRGYAMNNAMWLVQHRNMSLKMAHQRTGISEAQIRDKIQADNEVATLQKMGVDVATLSQKHLVRLASLKHDSHKKHLANIAVDENMSSDDLSKMVTQVNKLRTEARGNAYIHDEYNRRKREHVGPRAAADPPELRRRKVFLRGLRNFEDLWLKGNDGRPINSLSDVGISPQDRVFRQEVVSRGQDLIKVLQRVMRIKG
ncbi:MAG: hypothetical protein ACYSWU_13125 [Planctomycetota bacterium]|jgi:hypothetical protein